MTSPRLAAGDRFDVGALEAYLRAWAGDPHGAFALEPTVGGMSNPTYFVGLGQWRAVLRKQPGRVLVPSAHAIDREFRVLGALTRTDVPVPAPLHYCDDRAVIGTPFYLMQRIEGRVFHEFAAPGLAPGERRELYASMASTMAAIHRLDYRAIGLGDFGREGNYFRRQLSRWASQWAQFRRGEDDNPALDQIVPWLAARVPDSDSLALCHGDFRIGNLIFDAREPRVVGVLDWELSTLGHPLVDVAFNSQAWLMAPDENGGLLGLDLDRLGIPDEADYLQQYCAAAGSTERMTDFHRVFAMFRAAVGSAGVAIRGASGNSVLPDAQRIGRKLARAYASRAMALIGAG